MTLTYRAVPQLFTDGEGEDPAQIVTGGGRKRSGPISWEDDLVMTNVRSFDIKAYDNSRWRPTSTWVGATTRGSPPT